MKTIYAKLKILINGLFPIEGFVIDDFLFQIGKYDEKVIDKEHPDYIWYSSGYFNFSCYKYEGNNESYYNYFKNQKLIQVEVNDDIYTDSTKMGNYILAELSRKVMALEKKLRLITNFPIGLPMFTVEIYDSNIKYIRTIGSIAQRVSFFDITNYDFTMKDMILNRLKFWISDDTLEDAENKIERYKRGLEFYNASFLVNEIGIRFTLLFSSLESLFNLTGEKPTEKICKYTSKILFESPDVEKKYYKKISKLYDIRSHYIHGNEPKIISDSIEFELREIVRESLLMYWCIFQRKDINTSEDVIKFLDKYNQTNVDFQIQIFKKYLYATSYSDLYEEIEQKVIDGENILVNT